jgi:hypothetical protein
VPRLDRERGPDLLVLSVVSKDRVEVIRQKNQRLIDKHGWQHVVSVEEQL